MTNTGSPIPIRLPIPAAYIPATGSLTGRLIVADLTPLHAASTVPVNPVVGHHTDIFHPEIYRLISSFLFGP